MESRVPVAGSERAPVPGAMRVGDPDPDRRIQVTVTLRRRAGADPVAARAEGPLDRATFAERFGADPADVERVGPSPPRTASTSSTRALRAARSCSPAPSPP